MSGGGWSLERETGIEPATNSLEGCDSTTELLPPPLNAHSVRNYGGHARCYWAAHPTTAATKPYTSKNSNLNRAPMARQP